MTENIKKLVVKIDGQDKPITLTGRQAWTLQQLMDAGPRGCATVERPAPRWSDYVMRLRGKAIVIETMHEKHGGPYSGHHGRYRLHSEIHVIEREVAA